MKNKSAIIMAISAMLFWSTSFVFYKVLFKYNFRPFTIVFFRLVIASIFMSIIFFIRKKKEKIYKSDFPQFIILSMFEPFFYFIGESYGMQFVSATVGSIIISTIPVFTPLLSYLIIKEKISKLTFIGILISFIGVCIIAFNGDIFFQFKGILLLFLAVISGIMYGITVKNLAATYSSITIVKTQSVIGSLMFLPLFLILDLKHISKIELNFSPIFSMLALAILGSCLAFIFMTKVIRDIGVSKANIFTNLIPIFTGVFSYFILDEKFTPQKIIGVIIVLTGLFLPKIKSLITQI